MNDGLGVALSALAIAVAVIALAYVVLDRRPDRYLVGAVLVLWVGTLVQLVYGLARLWGRWRGSVWHSAVERGLSPIAAGLILAGGLAVLRVSPGGPAVWVAAGLSTVVILCRPVLHPLVLFFAGGVVFGLADMLGLW